jgi:hypothetical protein
MRFCSTGGGETVRYSNRRIKMAVLPEEDRTEIQDEAEEQDLHVHD